MELRGDAVTVATTTGFYLRYDSDIMTVIIMIIIIFLRILCESHLFWLVLSVLWLDLLGAAVRWRGSLSRYVCCRPIRTQRRAARCSCCRPIRMCLQDVSWPSMDNVQYVQVGGHGCYVHCKRKWGSGWIAFSVICRGWDKPGNIESVPNN